MIPMKLPNAKDVRKVKKNFSNPVLLQIHWIYSHLAPCEDVPSDVLINLRNAAGELDNVLEALAVALEKVEVKGR